MSQPSPPLDREAKWRLAVIRHVEEVTGNVAMSYRYFGIAGTRAVRADRMPNPPSADVPKRRSSLSGLFDEQLTSGAVTAVRRWTPVLPARTATDARS